MTAPTRSTSDSDLVKVAYAHDQAEAEFLQGCYTMRTWARSSAARRVSMCRSSLPPVRVTCSSPRPTSPSLETSCARVTRTRLRHRRGPAPTGRRGCSPGC
jgi:hypothetical protein